MSWWCSPRRRPAVATAGDAGESGRRARILREHGSGTREIVDYLLLSHLPQFQLALELGNSEAIKHAVRHGMGISCLSRRVIAEQLETGSLVEVPIPLPKLSRTLYRIHHRQSISRARWNAS